MDEHHKVLSDICSEIEETLGLSEEISGKPLSESGIEVILDDFKVKLKNISESDLIELNVEIFPLISVLSHLKDRMEFYEFLRLDFSEFPKIDIISKNLPVFINKSSLAKEGGKRISKSMNSMVSVLDLVDRKHLDIRYSMPYRYLRLFIILVKIGSYVEAGVLSNLILDQIERGGDSNAR